ncbi:IS607 family transposase [Moraxella canis]|uniref:Resolvase n=1 Tax=Moraxella canis TaxID=90239 RepID=A0A1S9ZNH7_9GAMM|nr:IS607 family transposase [Moraxella canis]OOR84918.1 resolvase [Moraxella canis]
MKYKISEYAKLNKVTYRTVWAWVKSGKVQSELTTTGRILIVDNEVRKQTVVCIYCRVSSSENKSNLDSQADRMIAYANARGYKVDKVIKEVGSGLNDNRKKLIDLLNDKTVDVIIVEHKDRLTRFGFNYIKTLLAMQNRKIEVVNQVIDEREDLIADFTSIITSFYARIYGQRRTKRKTEQLIKKLQDK